MFNVTFSGTDECATNSSGHVIHVISEPVGGGAQLLVRELNRRLPSIGIKSSAVYLTNKLGVELEENEYCLNLTSSRSPLAPIKLWRIFQTLSDVNTIIHGHLTMPLYYLTIPGLAAGLPLIYTEHNTYNRRRDIPIFRLLEKQIYKRFERIICISDATRSELLDWIGHKSFDKRAQVVINGGRIFDWKSDRVHSARGLRLVSIGTLNHKKGFDIAIDAVAKLNCPVERYVIIGEGDHKDKLVEQANKLGVQDIIQFVGWQDNVEKWLHASDIQLIPSRWEGFGLVAVEGLSTGIQVVASDVPGLNDVLKGTQAARLVEKENPNALADAIEQFFEQRDQFNELAVIARKRAEMYGLDSMVSEYARIYREVIEI